MKLWGGRFEKSTDELVHRYNASIDFDRRLYAADIQGSQAYARALADAGILTQEELMAILDGLARVQLEFDEQRFPFDPADEDIHSAVERRLHQLIGPVAGKLHTGRSRNDQVATDMRLFMLPEVEGLHAHIVALQAVIVDRAVQHIDLIMPGYTHLQQAQPVLWSHWLMSYFWMLARDSERLEDWRRRAAVSPLGAGALAGTPLELDRAALAADLGLDSISANSLDAVSDRDFVVEFLFCAALLQVHLSRLAEDLIIFSSREFGYVRIDEAYATGSSLMPQKMNPDPLELARGKTGRILGHLVGLLTTLKGLPSAYNKDMQEDKEPVFDALDTLNLTLPILAGIVRTLKVDGDRMASALDEGTLATELADYLVRQGVPFRQSHAIVGQAVRRAAEQDVPLWALSLETLQALHPAFGPDAYQVLDFWEAVEAKSAPGGTATRAVQGQIEKAQDWLQEHSTESTDKAMGF
jgi:argininosuccinate lyase